MSVLEIPVEVGRGTGKGAARQVRFTKKTPGILYGDKGSAGTPFAIDENKLKMILQKRPTMLKLTGGLDATCVVRELQRHPVSGKFVHIDLQEIRIGETIKLSIPVKFTGVAEGVKAGGVFEVIMHHIVVDVNPLEAPEEFVVEVSHLKMHEKIHVSDVTLPEGVKLIDELEDTVAVIHPAKHVEEAVAKDAPAAPEVITERKKDDEKESKDKDKDKSKGYSFPWRTRSSSGLATPARDTQIHGTMPVFGLSTGSPEKRDCLFVPVAAITCMRRDCGKTTLLYW